MPPGNQEVVLRPPAIHRAAGWGFLVFGTIFSLAPFAADESDLGWPSAVSMIGFGLLEAHIGISLSRARVVASPRGIRYRFGLILRNIPASEIEAVVTGPGSGGYYARCCVHVQRKLGARPVRLTALQRAATQSGRAAVEESAVQMRSVLGLGAA